MWWFAGMGLNQGLRWQKDLTPRNGMHLYGGVYVCMCVCVCKTTVSAYRILIQTCHDAVPPGYV